MFKMFLLFTLFKLQKSREEYFLDSAEEAEVFFGVLDTVFLISYAVGLYICGALGDR